MSAICNYVQELYQVGSLEVVGTTRYITTDGQYPISNTMQDIMLCLLYLYINATEEENTPKLAKSENYIWHCIHYIDMLF